MTRHDLQALRTLLPTEPHRTELLLGSLQSRYEEPWRHYHDAEHPLEMMSVLEQHRGLVDDVPSVVWAIAFHDAVYDPQASPGRNEELSAQLAEAQLRDLVDDDTVSRVAELVRATAEHPSTGGDQDLEIFLDLDLVILGADELRYDRYAADVRREYAHVPDADFGRGRTSVLTGLARRADGGGLFSTAVLQELFEQRAQANIAREIAALGDRG